jgi:hypothetical protein
MVTIGWIDLGVYVCESYNNFFRAPVVRVSYPVNEVAATAITASWFRRNALRLVGLSYENIRNMETVEIGEVQSKG